MWEVSASIGTREGRPSPVGFLSAQMRQALADHVRAVAAGVGDHDAGYWHTDSVSLHFRWPLTEQEMADLPDGWLACPAVDRGGNEDRMTKECPW